MLVIRLPVRLNIEQETFKALLFLDVMVCRDSNRLLSTTVYRKETFINRVFSFESNHPVAPKKGPCSIASARTTTPKRLKKISRHNYLCIKKLYAMFFQTSHAKHVALDPVYQRGLGSRSSTTRITRYKFNP